MPTDPRRQPQPPDHRPQGGDAQPGGGSDLPGADMPPILDQAFDRDSLYALRAAVAAHGAQAGLPQPRVEDLVIAAHELAANAIRHGAGHGRLRMWAYDGVLYCQVTDSGPDTEQESPQAAVLSGEPGHGIWLVRQVTDQAIVRSGPGGTSAVITFTVVTSTDYGRR